MKKIIMTTVLLVSLTACQSRTLGFVNGWEYDMNRLIDTTYDPATIAVYRELSGAANRSYAYWRTTNPYKVIDKVVDEDTSNKRYYITWYKGCEYSLLVDKQGKIIAWRYENKETEKIICTPKSVYPWKDVQYITPKAS